MKEIAKAMSQPLSKRFISCEAVTCILANPTPISTALSK